VSELAIKRLCSFALVALLLFAPPTAQAEAPSWPGDGDEVGAAEPMVLARWI